MTSIDKIYCELLHFGLLVTRIAVYSGKLEWAKREIDLLHNIPTLIGCEIKHHHQYFWDVERGVYLKWIDDTGATEAAHYVAVYYAPLWTELEPLLTAWFKDSRSEGIDGVP